MQWIVVPTGMLRSGSVLPDLDRRFRAAHRAAAPARHALGRDDVAALAVGVAQQREVRAAVRVVLEALDLGRDAVLVAPEIDDAVVLLVAAALVARGDVAHGCCGRRAWTASRSAAQCGSPLCRSGVTTLTSARRPGEVGLTLTSAMSLAYSVAAKLISWPGLRRT